MKKAALFAMTLAVAMAASSLAEAQQFFKQTLSNRLPDDMDATGVTVKFSTAPNPDAVKIKDHQDPAGSGELAKDRKSGTWAWTLDGSLKQIEVIADPTMPFVDTSDADLFWQTRALNNSKKTCQWRDADNAPLGRCPGNTCGCDLGGRVSNVTRRAFSLVLLLLENDGPTTLVFTNIQLYYNQSLGNFNLDNFTNVSGAPLTYHDVTVPPGSSVIISFSTPTLDENSYLYALADSYSNPDDVYGSGEAISVMGAAEP